MIHKTGRGINGGCNSFLSFIVLVYKTEFRNGMHCSPSDRRELKSGHQLDTETLERLTEKMTSVVSVAKLGKQQSTIRKIKKA